MNTECRKNGEEKEAFYNTLILVICILYVREGNDFIIFFYGYYFLLFSDTDNKGVNLMDFTAVWKMKT